MIRLKTALALLPLLCSAPLWATTFVYVSNAESGTVSRYQLSEANGSLQWCGDTPAGKKIMPLAASPDGKRLYGALRSLPYSIISWRVSGSHGDLQKLAVTPVAASFPWITTDRSGRYLLAASYDSDIVTSNRIDGKGIVTPQVTGEVKTGPHAHSVITDVSNHSLYVGNLGAD
ncbi:MAG: beta-propeller fold lactonase family protein, partial [Pantoea agglomerans]